MKCLEKIGNQLLRGVMYHNSAADLFDFLGLNGFYKWQKHQAMDELDSLCYVKHYVMKTHHMLLTIDGTAETPTLFPSNWIGKSAMDATPAEITKAVQSALADLVVWERDTITIYEGIMEETTSSDAKKMLCELIDGSKEEICQIEKLQLKLKSTGYNMMYVHYLQDSYCEKYKK